MSTSTAATSLPAAAGADRRLRRLRWYNLVMGAFHAAQGVAILLLARNSEFPALPVKGRFMAGPPGTTTPPVEQDLFHIDLAWGVAIFVFLSALAHWLIASPRIYDWYVKNLRRERNYARWIEYSISSSVMIVLIALLTGIDDVVALIAIFGVNASMILFGLLMEHYETPGKPNWMSFIFGCLAGIVPWIGIGIYLAGPGAPAEPPAFVYGIFFSIFAFFNVFALNMILQYKKVGKWRDYLYGEVAYVFLSLVAKSLLAWQVFAGTLAPMD